MDLELRGKSALITGVSIAIGLSRERLEARVQAALPKRLDDVIEYSEGERGEGHA